jgi:hydrogenase maturation protease
MKRIVCIGNALVAEDDAGGRVHEALLRRDLPHDVELVDGGIAGLNLLRWFDGVTRVVVVDAVSGFGPAGTVHEIDASEVASMAPDRWTHGSGLPYLLKMVPLACEGPEPDVVVVGVEMPADEASVQEAAGYALRAAAGEREGRHSAKRGYA